MGETTDSGTEKTVLVTGCSTCIGRATALQFRDADWEVYASARDPEEIADLQERGCRTMELDVTDDLEAVAAIDRIYEEQGRLDCLVNDAGYGQFGPVEDVPMERVIEQFDVNTFGPLRLVRAALARMRRQGRDTVVNVTAGIGGFTFPGIGVYNASKRALETATDVLRQEVADEDVEVVAVQPGFVVTDFYDRALAEIDRLDHSPAYADLYRVLDRIGIVEGGGPGINSPERVARTILTAATAERPDALYRVGTLPDLLTYLGMVVRGRVRDRVTKLGVAALSSDLAQRLLDRLETRQAKRRSEVQNGQRTRRRWDEEGRQDEEERGIGADRTVESRRLRSARRVRPATRGARSCAARSAARR
jgi:NAD(P)-dependent dehydrogenase (short-subunit alcohol dehydrogenase family)